ncbi:hypothetical protein [Chryseolinea lacunae]|uniref:Uncharacterized protein n=1 Tax=Chryseolinea lacunae TaxID=2801331 RepID=A0ABS1KJQ6_9BACT|nr:hypothetical protein [Chryseolinea lacunae]MBL0739683.1 hypothetical protein [Chryseolinea lacunae]
MPHSNFNKEIPCHVFDDIVQGAISNYYHSFADFNTFDSASHAAMQED